MKFLCAFLAIALLASPALSIRQRRATGSELDINWNQIGCAFCTLAFNFIDEQLLGEQITNTILMDIAKICAQLPSKDEQDQCISIIGSYGPILMKVVKQYLTPTYVCPKISNNVCTGQ